MAGTINIVTSAPFCDADGSPVAGTLLVTPTSKFRRPGAGQSVSATVRRNVTGGLLTGTLALPDPSQSSPTIGYTFVLAVPGNAPETWADVLIVADGNGNFDLALLNTGQWVPATPQTVISISGASATPQVLQLTSGPTSVSAYTAVSVSGGIGTTASSSNVAQMGSVAGLAVASVQADQPLTVQSQGQIEYNGWNFSPGLVFLAANGTVTQTAPTFGFLQVLGIAVAPTTVLLNLQSPILIQ